jgi:hypothetical protein
VLAAQYQPSPRPRDGCGCISPLAYFEPTDTEVAAKIEDNLLQANPGNSEIMSRIGDIYADRDLFASRPY